MALAMAALLVSEIAQMRAIDKSNALRSDSLTALVFQFEREFLRTRQALGEALVSRTENDADALSLRYDIFLSRLTLLRDSPSVALLTGREEYRKVFAGLEPLLVEMDAALSDRPIRFAGLANAQKRLNTLGPDVQALTLAADSEVALLLEHQSDAMGRQNGLIVWLTIAQLALLTIASGALVMRHRRLEAERRAMEQLTQELREARFRAESASRGKSQFLANMSHELRTPFNGLIGMLDLLQSTPMNAEQTDYVQMARTSAGHLLTLLNDVLDLSALESGKLSLKSTYVAVPHVLADVAALMQPLAKSKGLEFHIDLPQAVLPLVFVDETRLKQILFNLLNNAIKFTEIGHVHLKVFEAMRMEQTIALEFEITDTGIGMDSQTLSRLFQRFSQGDDSRTRKFGGAGLGLEISQSLARMMDGEITVRSVVGTGSTFTVKVRVPFHPGLSAAAANSPLVQPNPVTQEPTVTGEGATADVVTQDMRVLVVEDHPINQKLVAVLLRRMGCEATFCENGEQALDWVQRKPFDMVLMDVNMPVMDGLTATRAIRALQGAASKLPIVVLTADVMNDANGQALAAGANDFLSKPVNADRLRALVGKYAGEKTFELS
ncbi:response regulator [Rhodoferax sp. GW822-FHT02A01]|uniref:response regulator n=1 Tax=Rhodoferax sp. GW822-FHT02A01 TaxID=3141537 RepID=UPI00315DA6C7